MKHFLRRKHFLIILGVLIPLLYYQCQQDDVTSETIVEESLSNTTTRLPQTKKVTLEEIPLVTEPIIALNKGYLPQLEAKSSLKNNNNKNTETGNPFGTIDTSNVYVVIYDNGDKNYSLVQYHSF